MEKFLLKTIQINIFVFLVFCHLNTTFGIDVKSFYLLDESRKGINHFLKSDGSFERLNDLMENENEILAMGLVGHWKLDEGSGSTFLDSSVEGNDGTLQNTAGVSWVPAVRGLGVDLPGSTGRFAYVPDSESLDLTESLTIAAWIRPSQSRNATILSKVGGDGYELNTTSGGLLEFRLNTGSNGTRYRLRSNSVYPTDGETWMHVAATFDGSTMRLYIDGLLDSSVSFEDFLVGSNSSPLGIGTLNGNRRFNGVLDDVRLYGRSLTESEIGILHGGDSYEPQAPEVPVLISPSEGSTGIEEAFFIWSVTGPTDLYRLQISRFSDFSDLEFDFEELGDTLLRVEGLAERTDYFWRVLSGNPFAESEWSSVGSFRTIDRNFDVSSEGLVGHWKLDEGSGSTFLDSSVEGNDGTLQNTAGVSWVPAVRGLGVDLPGSTGRFAYVPDSESLDLTESLTIAAWIRPSQSRNATILSKVGGDGYELNTTSGGLLEFRLNTGSNGTRYRLRSNSVYPTDGETWMHVAATFDGSTMRLYIDGLLDSSVSFEDFLVGSNSSPLGIGTLNGNRRFNGVLDDVRLYGRSLTESEIGILHGGDSYEPQAPEVPVLISPSEGSTGIEEAFFIWSVTGPTDLYRLQISRFSDFSDLEFDFEELGDTLLRVEGLAERTDYFWRVLSGNPFAESEWSSVGSFRTIDRNFDVSSEGLVGHWKLDEGSGSTFLDSSVEGNDGTLQNTAGVSWVPAVRGLGVDLPGSTGRFAYVPDSESLDLTESLTIAAWIRPSQSRNATILSKVGGDGYELNTTSGGLLEFRLNTGSNGTRYRLRSNSVYPTDGETWMHVAATFDGSTMRLYIDGLLDSSVSFEDFLVGSNSSPLGIGTLNGNRRFNGVLDDVRLYGRSLTESEIGILHGGDSYEPQAPEVPVLISPSEGSTGIEEAFFIWSVTGPTDLYRLQISRFSDFSDLEFDFEELGDTLLRVEGLAERTDYFWRVLSGNPFAESEWSSVGSFRTIDRNFDVSSEGLVGHWKLDEGSGSTFLDSSVEGNDGTLQNTAGVSWVPAVRGLGVDLPGSTGRFAYVPDSESLDLTESLTIAAWIRPSQSRNATILSKVGGDGYELNTTSGGLLEFRLNTGSNGTRYRLRSNSAYPTDGETWMHVAATFDGSTMRLYIDGLLDSSVSFEDFLVGSNSSPLGIGTLNGNRRFNGVLDDVRLYGRSLTESEIGILHGGDSYEPQAPEVPVLISPSEGSTGIEEAFFIWSVTGPTDLYRLQISRFSDFSDLEFDFEELGDTLLRVEGLAERTDYFWRVLSGNPFAESEWSSVGSFRTIDRNFDVSSEGLVGHWNLDEGSGSTFLDSSVEGNDGTLQNTAGVSWVPAVRGLGVDLPGSTGRFAYVPDSESLDLTESLTIAAWIRPSQSRNATILSKVGGDGYELNTTSGGLLEFRLNTGSNGTRYRLRSNSVYPTDGETWMHVAATFDGSTMRLYIDGLLDSSVSFEDFLVGSNSSSLGIGTLNGNRRFNGVLDDVRLYGRSLSEEEVALLFGFDQFELTPIDVPQLISPLNGISNLRLFNLFEWEEMEEIDEYVFQLSLDPEFESLVYEIEGINGNQIDIEDLDYETQYFWRVAAKNLDQTSDWSETWAFKTRRFIPTARGLIGLWNFDEGLGDVFYDDSDFENHAILDNNNELTWEEGLVDFGANFNGNPGSSAVALHHPSLNVSTALSISVWIKPEGIQNSSIISKWDDGGFELALAENGRIEFNIQPEGERTLYTLTSNSEYPTDGETWMQVIVIFNGLSMEMYIDGDLDDFEIFEPFLVTQNEADLEIGSLEGAKLFSGKMDILSLFNRALFQWEIDEFYEDGLANLRLDELQFEDEMLNKDLINSMDLFGKSYERTSIYPNPVRDHLFVRLGGKWSDFIEVIIYDMTGKVHFQGQLSNEFGLLEVEIGSINLANGVYMLNVIDLSGKIESFKFIKK
jgi:hypothetical protein